MARIERLRGRWTRTASDHAPLLAELQIAAAE
jgi:endonuclease/exonuclease/phosphatase family metal-dependent hydrolase